MFKFNERELGGTNAKYYVEGMQMGNICENNELVFGQYSSKKTHYYFTNKSIVIVNGQFERLIINEITETNGSFRSDQKHIYVVTNGRKVIIQISELPYRLQQLFYQLIEHHGSLSKTSIFKGLTRLEDFSKALTEEEQRRYNIQAEKEQVAKSIIVSRLSFYGKLKDGIIFPNENGVIVIKAFVGDKEIELFNSQTDGYNGVTEIYAGRKVLQLLNFETLINEETSVIIFYTYSIAEEEFKELKDEIGLKNINEVNNLFGSFALYIEKDMQLRLLTEVETQ